MARRVIDLAMLFSVMADDAPIDVSAGEFAQNARRQLGGLQVAYYLEDGIAPVTAETSSAIAAAAKALAGAGLQVREDRPPAVSEGSRLWVELFSQAASEQLREFYRGREDEAGPRVAAILRRQPEDNTFENRIKAAERLAQAVVERERRREELLRWMKATPLLLAPVGSSSGLRARRRACEYRGTIDQHVSRLQLLPDFQCIRPAGCLCPVRAVIQRASDRGPDRGPALRRSHSSGGRCDYRRIGWPAGFGSDLILCFRR